MPACIEKESFKWARQVEGRENAAGPQRSTFHVPERTQTSSQHSTYTVVGLNCSSVDLLLPIHTSITAETYIVRNTICARDMRDRYRHGSKASPKACSLVESSTTPNIRNSWSNSTRMRSQIGNLTYYMFVKRLHCHILCTDWICVLFKHFVM